MTHPEDLADILFPAEDEASETQDILDVPPEKRRLHTETYDFAISTLLEYLRDKRMFVPEFQRHYVWSQSQASRLIESLIIQCPIPVIYLNQQPDETLSIIDGNQRLNSIQAYVENRYQLRGLTAYPELVGLRFHQLDPRFQRHILNRTIRCIVIMKDTHPQVKFDVFERLNSGSVRLSAQELRHGLYHGKLMFHIEKLAKDKAWRSAIGLRKDVRMRAEELVLRFLALRFWEDRYKKPLASFLNDFAENHRRLTKDDEQRFADAFAKAAGAVVHVFGNKSFRMLDARGEPLGGLNVAVADAEMLSLGDYYEHIAGLSQKERGGVLLEYAKLMQNSKFAEAVSKATSDEVRVHARIRLARSLSKRLFG